MTRPDSRPYSASSANASTDAAFNDLRASIEDAIARNEAAIKRYRVEHTDGNVSYLYSDRLGSIKAHREHTPETAVDLSGIIIAVAVILLCVVYVIAKVSGAL